MRNIGTNYEVIQAFADNEKGPHTNQRCTVYFDTYPPRKYDVIYSYGSHFPMCYRFYAENPILKQTEELYIVNGDSYSPTTSQHQSDLQTALREKNSFTTSFDALRSAGINITDCEIIDYTQDTEKHMTEEDIEGLDEKDIPKGATIYRDEDKVITGWHLAASMIIQYKRKQYICGMDEDSYFVSQLPRKVKTVKEAFNTLKPRRIIEAEALGLEIRRQGEWFCIKYCNGKKAKQIYKILKPKFILPRENNRSNPHTATRGYIKNSRIYFSGSLRHPDHKMLKVSIAKTPEIWEAIKNTAKGSWSEQGVD